MRNTEWIKKAQYSSFMILTLFIVSVVWCCCAESVLAFLCANGWVILMRPPAWSFYKMNIQEAWIINDTHALYKGAVCFRGQWIYPSKKQWIWTEGYHMDRFKKCHFICAIKNSTITSFLTLEFLNIPIIWKNILLSSFFISPFLLNDYVNIVKA